MAPAAPDTKPAAPAPISNKKSDSGRWMQILKSWLFRFLVTGAAFGVVYFRTSDTADASIVASCVFLTSLFAL